MKLRITLALLVVLVVAAACAAPPELRNPAFLVDDSLVTNDPCEAPCWRGITPGETEWRDALTILEDDPTLADIRTEANDETGEIAATFQRVDGVPCCLVYSSDGQTVDQMLLQLAPDNTLAQVLQNFGEPTFFSGTEVSPEQAAAALFYPDRQVVVYAFVAGPAEGQITADSEVFAALYLTEDDMQEVLRTSNLHDWLGYDSYAAYTARPFDITPVPTADVEVDGDTEETGDLPTEEPTLEATATEG